ncbi:MAG: hypothetical protein KatS3mg050_5010 [Litorilinea sp.]|nr:MAG: hypothetical protein KatS3mg050_5010 [Litorilinea sp.]
MAQVLALLVAWRHDREDWAGVVEAAEELVALGASDGAIWAMLADARSRLGDEMAAAEAYARAVELDGQNAMLRRNYVNTLIALNRLEDAAAQLAVAAQLEPDAPYLPLRYAELAKARGDRQEARRWALEALRRQPGWDEAQALLDWANSQADSPASFPGDSGR